MKAISAAGSAVVAVGQSYCAKPLLTHWDGATWIRDPLPNRHAEDAYLWGVSATGPTDAWAAGNAPGEGGWDRPHTWHWDGVVSSSVSCPGVDDSKRTICGR